MRSPVGTKMEHPSQSVKDLWTRGSNDLVEAGLIYLLDTELGKIITSTDCGINSNPLDHICIFDGSIGS